VAGSPAKAAGAARDSAPQRASPQAGIVVEPLTTERFTRRPGVCQAGRLCWSRMDADLIPWALSRPIPVIAFDISRKLTEMATGRAVVETATPLDVLGFARAGHAEARLSPGVHSEVITDWVSPAEGLHDQPVNAWLSITHEGA